MSYKDDFMIVRNPTKNGSTFKCIVCKQTSTTTTKDINHLPTCKRGR